MKSQGSESYFGVQLLKIIQNTLTYTEMKDLLNKILLTVLKQLAKTWRGGGTFVNTYK